MTDATRTGGCLCGAVRYAVSGAPLRTGTCHCNSCRRTASAPGLPFAVFPAAAFRVTAGTPAAFRSSPPVTRSFCGRCGSPLTYRTSDDPDFVDVMLCSLDDADAVPPERHVFAAEKLSWDRLADGLPIHAGSSTDPPG